MSRDALVVGINLYANLNPLEKPANDAETIAQLLETKGGFRVTRLPGIEQEGQHRIDSTGAVGFAQLQTAIVQLFKSEIDTALLFFAGHNLPEGFIAASDTHPSGQTKALSFQWLADLLQDSPVRQQIIWLDACFSGKFFDFVQAIQNHNRCLITSARAHEEALDQGLLTQALLEALDYTRQSEETPWITNDTLVQWLAEKNETVEGWQRFQFHNEGQPIVLTNEAFEHKIDTGVCPFRGLRFFDSNPEDVRYFKGRRKLTEELLEKIKDTNFLAVLGASGNGKSSVVRAGLLYQLRQTQRWKILPVITPTVEPIKALGATLGMPAEQITDFIEQMPAERIVLVIDQFETVFDPRQSEAEREQFFATLLAAVARADNKFCLVVVMRADFLDKCSHYADLAHKIQENQVIVTSMTPAELEEAIVVPIKQVGLKIEPKLVAEMLADVKGALVSLPLLQYTLTELWKQCAVDRLLTFSAYESLGKIAGTLEKGANRVYEQLSPTEQETAKQIFIELTQLGEGTPDTRRQLSQQDLVTLLPFESVPVSQVLQKLVDANLLVTDKPREEQVAVVDIAHEALTQHWRRLREWLNSNREAIKVKRSIETDAKKWRDSNRARNALLQGLDLNVAQEYEKTHTKKVPLSALAVDFVQRSVKRQRHYWMGVIGSVLGVILVLAGIAFYANEQRITANEQRDNALRAQSSLLVDIAERETVKGNATQGTLLALEALPKDMSNPDKPYVPKAEETLYRAVVKPTERMRLIQGKGVKTITLSPDGNYAITSSFGYIPFFIRLAYLWDVHTGKLISELKHTDEDEGITLIKFSPDSQRIVTVGNDTGRVYLWDVHTGKLISEFKHTDEGITLIKFSLDSQRIVMVGNDTGRVYLWDVHTGKQQISFEIAGTTKNITFNPDGQHLLALSAIEENMWGANSAFLWDANTRKGIKYLRNDKIIRSIHLNPDQKTLTVITRNNDIVLIDLHFQVITSKTIKLDKPLKQAFFSPSQRFLALIIASPKDKEGIPIHEDDTIILEDIETNQTILEESIPRGTLPIFSPDERFIAAVEFNPDEHFIPDLYDQEGIFLWNTKTGKRTELKGAGEPFVFSPNGRFAMTACEEINKTACLWDMNTGMQLAKLVGHASQIQDIKFSHDGNSVFTISGDNGGYTGSVASVVSIQYLKDDDTIRVWDINTDKKIKILTPSFEDTGFAFSPSNKYIATLLNNGMAYLWDVKTGKQLMEKQIGVWDSSLRAHSSYIAFIDDKNLFAENYRANDVQVWNIETNELSTFAEREYISATSPDFRYLFITYNDENDSYIDEPIDSNIPLFRIQETITGKQIALENFDSTENREIFFSPHGEYLLSASTIRVENNNISHKQPLLKKGIAQIWETKTGKQLHVLEGYKSGKEAEVFFSPNGQRVIIYSSTQITTDPENDISISDFSVGLWDVQTGKRVLSGDKILGIKKESDYSSLRVNFSPDGQWIATNTSQGIWNITTGKQLENTDHIPPGGIFGPKGKYLIVYSSEFDSDKQSVIIWDTNNGKEVAKLIDFTQSIKGVIFSLDGQRIITMSNIGNTIRVWDVKTGKQVTTLQGYHALLSPDNQYIVTDSVDGIVRLYPFFSNTQDLIDHARQTVPQQFIDEQHKQFFGIAN